MIVKKQKKGQIAKLLKKNKKSIIFVCKRNLASRILIKPILKDLQFKYKEKIFFYEKKKISTKFQEQYAIHRYPTFLFFNKGVLVDKLEGFVNRRKLFSHVQKFMKDQPIKQKV